MSDWYNKTWKPVSLNGAYGKRGGGGQGAGYSSTNRNWYNDIVQHSDDRLKKLDQYDQMDEFSVDVSRALDMLAEDISSDGAEDDQTFEVDFPESTKVTSSATKTLEKMLFQWKDVTEMDYKFFDYARELMKYGALFFTRKKDGTLKKINSRRFVGYKVQRDEPDMVTHYIAEKKVREQNGHIRSEYEEMKIEDLIVIKLGETPFGESVLARVYSTWKKLQLLEDATVIYQIVRAPERRVFYVDIGRLSASKAESYLNKFKARMRQKQRAKSGEISNEYNPSSMQEDFYVATSGEGRGSRVETLPGGSDQQGIINVTHFNKKLLMGLRIPQSYMEAAWSDGSQQQSQNNDGRVGMAYMAELRYVGYVKRVQKIVSKSLFDHYQMFCLANEVEVPDDIIFRIAPPQSFAEYRLNDLYSALMNTAASATSVKGMSSSYVMEKYLMLDKTEVAEMEFRSLVEKGYTTKEIKALDDDQKRNIIYGNGILGTKEIPEDQGGGMFG